MRQAGTVVPLRGTARSTVKELLRTMPGLYKSTFGKIVFHIVDSRETGNPR